MMHPSTERKMWAQPTPTPIHVSVEKGNLSITSNIRELIEGKIDIYTTK